MTQSDKDFITRIQVSQLVTQDPYADDFYAQVYGAILRSRLGLQSQDERVLKFGSGGGIGLGLASKGGSRRPSAMQRMEQQVERIVSNARKREEEKGLHGIPICSLFLALIHRHWFLQLFTVYKVLSARPRAGVIKLLLVNYFKLTQGQVHLHCPLRILMAIMLVRLLLTMKVLPERRPNLDVRL
jgi:hypothetical protein